MIPILDMTPARAGDRQALADLGSGIVDACSDVGFFYVTGHGIPEHVLADCLEAGKRFFQAPLAEKLLCSVNRRHRGYVAMGDARMYGTYKPDQKESFKWAVEFPESEECQLYGPNQWPEGHPRLEQAGSRYLLATMRCGDLLLKAIALALGLDDDFFELRYRRPISRGGIIHYPPQQPVADEDEYGVAPHTDYGCLTLLWQDSSGGLQVLDRSGEWVDASPVPDTYVVNVGDLLARWTNGLLPSNAHRVINTSGHDRYSVVVFHDPEYSTVVDPRDVDPRATPEWPPVVAGEYVFERFSEAFTYRD